MWQIGLLAPVYGQELIISAEQILDIIELRMLMHDIRIERLIRLTVVYDIKRQWRVTNSVLHAVVLQRLKAVKLLCEKVQLIADDIRRILVPEPLRELTYELCLMPHALKL